MKGSIEVAVGQVWADNDWRQAGREVQVESINEGYAIVRVIRHPKAPSAVMAANDGHRTRIRLDRFRPTSTGFKLVI